ncbi:hypothetical protein SCYAM73S_06257 [Streptomyces cyaneofuscatus]
MNRAVSAARTRSQANARCAPIPAAVPFTAAITGFSQSSTAAMSRCVRSSQNWGWAKPSSACRSRMKAMSAS